MIVRGTAQWAHVFEPNELSGKYQVDICNLDKKTVKQLQSVGISVKSGDGEKAEKGQYITAKSGKYAPRVLDRRGHVMDGSTLIGNGSKVKIQFKEWETTWQGQAFKGLDFQAMQVIDLVEFGSPDGSEFDIEDDDGDEL